MLRELLVYCRARHDLLGVHHKYSVAHTIEKARSEGLLQGLLGGFYHKASQYLPRSMACL